jgi:carbonic anhydrase/acetyltransferase-like protein (isoleucine patch superfamily)
MAGKSGNANMVWYKRKLQLEPLSMPLYPYHGVWPTLAEDVMIAPGAMIAGDVRLGPGVSIWYNAVLRADGAPIIVGARSNIQDNAVIHVERGVPCVIGEDCTVGHSAIVHAAQIGSRVLVAMGAVVLSGAAIGDDVIIGAKALVPEHMTVAGGVIVLGSPGKVIRPLTEAEMERVRRNAAGYLYLGQEHRESLRTAGLADGSQRARSTESE